MRPSKFSDFVPTMTYSKMIIYMKSLLTALEHIHSLGIIHRDVKPANFLFDFVAEKFYLIDFGLAQTTGEVKFKGPIAEPQCKRKLTSSDLGESSGESPVKKKGRPQHHHPPPPPPALTSRQEGTKRQPQQPKTPTRTNSTPAAEYYDHRGSLRRGPTKHITTIIRKQQEADEEAFYQENYVPKPESTTPKKSKTLEQLAGEIPGVRRSPRKHQSLSRKSSATGFSKLTISGSAIVGSGPSGSLTKTPSFTILDPTSGIPSADYTPRLQASLTSRSFGNSSVHSTSVNIHHSLIETSQCGCYGLPRICNKCSSSEYGRRSMKAARAGTPGFRPPEVLLKCEYQTTAVDMWAAGVILLCILSRTYPFFRAQDDMANLGEILCLFGTEKIREAACQYGRKLLSSEGKDGVDLHEFCQRLASRDGCVKSAENLVTPESIDLLSKLLKLVAHERISAQDALKHPIFKTKSS